MESGTRVFTPFGKGLQNREQESQTFENWTDAVFLKLRICRPGLVEINAQCR